MNCVAMKSVYALTKVRILHRKRPNWPRLQLTLELKSQYFLTEAPRNMYIGLYRCDIFTVMATVNQSYLRIES